MRSKEAAASRRPQASGVADFFQPDSAAENRDFKLKRVAPPKGFESFFEDVLLVERIREVRALLGFTRIESNADFAEATILVGWASDQALA